MLLFACGLCVLLTAATCWSWSGQRSRLLSLEQAVHAAERDTNDVAARLHAHATEIVRTLRTMAAEESVRGAHARHALRDLAEKLAK